MAEKNKEQQNRKKVSNFEEVFIKGQLYKNIITKKSVWERLAQDFNGKLSVSKTIRQDTVLLRLRITYKGVKLLVIETDTKPLKFEISINLKVESEFTIYWEDGVEKLFKMLGKKEILLGEEEFDKRYMIVSKEKNLTRDLLVYSEIFQTLLNHNIYSFSLDPNGMNGAHKLITTKDRNTEKYDVIAELIQMQFSLIDFFVDKDLINTLD